MKLKLSEREINYCCEDVFNIIKSIPIYNLHEIIEIVVEERIREGEKQDIDYTSSSEEEEEEFEDVASTTSESGTDSESESD